MNALLNYLIEASIALMLFYVIYYLLLRKETNFNFVRFYLLLSLIISLLLPFVPTINLQVTTPLPQLTNVMTEQWLPEVVVGNNVAQHSNEWTMGQMILLIYTIGISLFVIKFILEGIHLTKLLKHSRMSLQQNNYVLEVADDIPSFSIFHYIVLGNAEALTYEEREAILNHEKIHAQQYHSFDKLLIVFIVILFWFNPIVYLYRKALVQLHEFEADSRAVTNHEVEQYCNLLARVALHTAGFPIANHFTNSLTLKRIAMIKSVKHTMAGWKKAMLVPTCALVFFVIACDRQAVNDTKEVTMKSVIVTGYSTFPKEVQKAIDAIKAKNPDAEFQVVGVAGDSLDKETINFIDEDKIKSMTVIKDIPNSKFKSYIILEKGSATVQSSEPTKGDKVYTTVEHVAEYPGGYPELAKFLGSNIKYPTEAKAKGITGKVFVKFVVGEDGSISDAAITKGLNPECDAEALRVIKLMPKWTAAKDKGENVKSIFTLPIVFQLH